MATVEVAGAGIAGVAARKTGRLNEAPNHRRRARGQL
jgi:hypothetical protein